MEKKFVIGIDIGTSGCKCIALNRDGQILGSRVKGVPAVSAQGRMDRAESGGLVVCCS